MKHLHEAFQDLDDAVYEFKKALAKKCIRIPIIGYIFLEWLDRANQKNFGKN